MKLLQLLLIIFAVYFIRRFIQLYRVMKQLQENQLRAQGQNQHQQQRPPQKAQGGPGVIDVEYKVIDS